MMFRRVILVPVLVLVAAASVTAQLYQVEKHGFEKPLVFLNFATEEPPLFEAPSEEVCDWELDTEVCVKRLLEKEGDKKIKRGWVNLRARHQNHTLYWKDNLDLWKTMTVKIQQRMGELKETKAKERELLKRRLEEQLLKMEEEEKKKEETEGKKLKESPGLGGLSKAEMRRKLEELKQKIRAEWQKKIVELELTMKAMLAQI
ncbi:uncharacterized protein LOC124272864 [Haliotis rubra]|uniref:uncharacterized protein LOC124272864 n=1 Tax=Haliotis rubra TaxID=36100 RepID=UPI001EE55737|nr:uncharacterized protein LOC124272864 [Haliotis rubra]